MERKNPNNKSKQLSGNPNNPICLQTRNKHQVTSGLTCPNILHWTFYFIQKTMIILFEYCFIEMMR